MGTVFSIIDQREKRNSVSEMKGKEPDAVFNESPGDGLRRPLSYESKLISYDELRSDPDMSDYVPAILHNVSNLIATKKISGLGSLMTLNISTDHHRPTSIFIEMPENVSPDVSRVVFFATFLFGKTIHYHVGEDDYYICLLPYVTGESVVSPS